MAGKVEVLFKAKSKRRTSGLVSDPEQNLSITWAEKGSYRAEHILQFLRRWLDPWTAEREAAGDWRILMLDVARSHLDEEIAAFAETRGYIVLLHYGCTTGIAQVNDTDLHAELSRVYLHLEAMRFVRQQQMDPGNISRTPQDVLWDISAAWRAVDHSQGLRGHWRVGMANALDGSEDGDICREAHQFWQLCNMPEERRKAIAEVNQRVDSGELSSFPGDWRKVIVHPADAGVVEEEGAELEGELEKDECVWEEAEQVADEKKTDEDDFLGDEASVATLVTVRPDDPPDAVVEASVAARRLAQLQDLRKKAMSLRVPAAAFSVAREVEQLQRGLAAGSNDRKRKANEVLRREMDRRFADEFAKVQAAAREAMETRRKEAKAREAAIEDKAKAILVQAAKDKAKEDRLALAKRLDDLPKTISAADAAQPGAAGAKVRADAFERIKLRAPALPEELEAAWPKIRDDYSRTMPEQVPWLGAKAASDYAKGAACVKMVSGVLEALGVHYKGSSKWNQPGAKKGDPQAFTKLARRMQAALPKPALCAHF